MIEEFHCLGVKHGPGFNSGSHSSPWEKPATFTKEGSLLGRLRGGRWDRNKKVQKKEREWTHRYWRREERKSCHMSGVDGSHVFACILLHRKVMRPLSDPRLWLRYESDTNIRTMWEVWFRSPDIKNQRAQTVEKCRHCEELQWKENKYANQTPSCVSVPLNSHLFW